MKKKFGFDLLTEQTLEFVAAEMDCLREEAVGDSEIEKLLYSALVTRVRIGATEHTSILVAEDNDHFNRLLSSDVIDKHLTIILRRQVQLEGWRVDFVLTAFYWNSADFSAKAGEWRHLIIECDGHNYHERTKEQAARDRARDRKATYDGMEVYRFTGSELWRDPWACAEEVLNWASRGFGA